MHNFAHAHTGTDSCSRSPDVCDPPEAVPAPTTAGHHLEVGLTCVGILITGFAGLKVGRELAEILHEQIAGQRWDAVALHLLFCSIVVALIYGGLVYQLTRALYYLRRSRHTPERSEDLDALRDPHGAPLLTILVPAFKEEPQVVFRTLLSAAFQTYPRRRIALLIDDPPFPDAAADRASLEAVRKLPARVTTLLSEPRSWVRECIRTPTDEASVSAAQMVQLLRRVAHWFENLAEQFNRTDHEERCLAERILLAHACDCRTQALRIETAEDGDREASPRLVRQACEFLEGLFAAEFEAFERKLFANLSHEPNKAMNLNSYIGLLGKAFAIARRGDLRFLVPALEHAADLRVPDSDFLITLDADSVIMPDYALRLIHLMRRPGNERLAVVQTPYSAFPGAPGPLERLAGATTDIQYIIHQGFTACSGTYWVGANALLRKAALEDIATQDTERGHRITRYIQDRTVIEDTESSIDLVSRGWSLHNYPDRLAFSATPPDFGALLIQRRRWANGGLLILPKLLKHLTSNLFGLRTWVEGFVRVHYLVSIAAINVGLLIALAVPFTGSIRSWWLPVTALPYFVLYARDLKLSGYRYSDVFGVYALNLLLIPVNLGGVARSIQQAWTGKKTPFGRTPKVNGRTGVAAVYLIAVYALLLQWLIAGGVDLYCGRIYHGLCVMLNVGFLGYALLRLVGLSECWNDLMAARAARPPRVRNLMAPAMAPEFSAPSGLVQESAQD